MPLLLQPLEEAELETYFDVAYAALSDNGLWALVFPNGFSPADREFMAKALLKDWQASPERNLLVKVIDTGLPAEKQVVGVSRWILYRDEKELEHETTSVQASQKKPALAPGMDVSFRHGFLGAIAHKKSELMRDQPFMYLQLLAVRPGFQQRGTGTLHMQWGTEKADTLGLSMYVESGLAGLRLYKQFGFEVVEHLSVGQQWDQDERATVIAMRRPVRHLAVSNHIQSRTTSSLVAR